MSKEEKAAELAQFLEGHITTREKGASKMEDQVRECCRVCGSDAVWPLSANNLEFPMDQVDEWPIQNPSGLWVCECGAVELPNYYTPNQPSL